MGFSLGLVVEPKKCPDRIIRAFLYPLFSQSDQLGAILPSKLLTKVLSVFVKLFPPCTKSIPQAPLSLIVLFSRVNDPWQCRTILPCPPALYIWLAPPPEISQYFKRFVAVLELMPMPRQVPWPSLTPLNTIGSSTVPSAFRDPVSGVQSKLGNTKFNFMIGTSIGKEEKSKLKV